MTERISLSFTPHGLDAVAMGLQLLQSAAGAAIEDIRGQLTVQKVQPAPAMEPTKEEAPQEAAGLQGEALPQESGESAS